MKKTLIVTTVVVVLGGVAVNEVYKAFNNSPLGTLKKLNDRKETIEKAIEDPSTLIKQPALKLQ